MCVFSTSDVPVYGTAPWHIIEWQINACTQIVFALDVGLKVGQMTWAIWVTWVTFW